MEMALTMTHINNIKELYFSKGLNVAEISRETGFDRKTIDKYLTMTDFNQKPAKKKGIKRPSKLDPFKKTIIQWLEDDKKRRKKQRHTAKRIHDRLIEKYKDDYGCSYRLIADYVRLKKKEEPDFFIPLQHAPGEAQLDFGQADFIEEGTLYPGHYLNLSFPYSNTGYLQMFRGENLQCLIEGMVNIFRHIGGVPPTIVFDNASSIVSDIAKNKDRTLTEGFIRFKNHYGFQSVFCNPASGHEKGNVEKKVGYHRKNFFVPEPEFNDLIEFNKTLLPRLDKDQNREHYRKNTTIKELFKEDLNVLLALPEVEFEAANIICKRTDANACINLYKGLHRYSTKPSLAKSSVHVKLTAHQVLILDEDFKEVVTHDRLYGETKQESFKWIPYLEQISKRPRALKYSGIYNLFPERIKDYLDNLNHEKLKDILKILNALTEETSFQTAVDALLDAIEHGANDSDSIRVLFKRKNSNIMPFNSKLIPADAPVMPELKPDINFYDSFYTMASAVEQND